MEGNFGPLPYYRFYLYAYRNSPKVQAMGYVERGFYRELLDECWDKGFIPDNIADLAKICGCPKSRLARAWPTLSKCFISSKYPGKLTNHRMMKEILATSCKLEKRRKAGSQGGLQKAENARIREANANKFEANASHCLASREKEYIGKPIYSLKTVKTKNPTKDKTKYKTKTYSDPGIPCIHCGNFAGYADPNDPGALYVCSQQCKEAYEAKATSSATEPDS
jgi:uncharacterized protein YdaU (DUF1376 family)